MPVSIKGLRIMFPLLFVSILLFASNKKECLFISRTYPKEACHISKMRHNKVETSVSLYACLTVI